MATEKLEPNEIRFDEGETHTVLLTVDNALPLAGYTPRLEVRKQPHTPIIIHYDSEIQVIGQEITVIFEADDSVGKCGVYQWQLMLTSGSTVVKFPAAKITITPAIVQAP
jgi:hypothetical protein